MFYYKKNLNTKEHGNERNEAKEKAARRTENKEQMDTSKSLLISNHFTCKWLNSPTKRRKVVEQIKRHIPIICYFFNETTLE